MLFQSPDMEKRDIDGMNRPKCTCTAACFGNTIVIACSNFKLSVILKRTFSEAVDKKINRQNS